MSRIDFRALPVPASFSSNAYVEKNAIVEGGFINGVLRTIIPGYAKWQDRKITLFFLNHFKDLLKQEPVVFDMDKCRSIIALSQVHLSRSLQGRLSKAPTQEIVEMERYNLAIRMRLKDFSSLDEETQCKALCQSHCKELYNKWTRAGHSEEVFWHAPDLVDLVMRTFVHKAMRHREYNHTISMEDCVIKRAGNYICEREPHIKIQGNAVPWSEARNLFLKDEDNRIYSIDPTTQKKVYWWYFQEGFIPWDKFNWPTPHAFTVLKEGPMSCQVEVVTSQVKLEHQNVLDRYLKGVRHVFLRVVFRQGFEQGNPERPYKNGEVYSFGFGFDGKNFSKLSPLATIPGKMLSPDYAEFEKDDLCVTPINISDDKAVELMNSIIKRAHEPVGFHFVHSNCADAVGNLLSESDILHLPIEKHMLTMWYEFIVPNSIRRPIKKVGRFFERIVPNCISNFTVKIAQFVHSIVFGPIFVFIGAFRVGLDSEDSCFYKWRESAKPHFKRFFDIFNPNKMVFTEVRMIANWQKRQPQTCLVKT